MYFDFEDNRPDTPSIARPLSRREVVMFTIIVYLGLWILLLLAPKIPWVQAMIAKQQQQLAEQRQREMERQRQAARFVFVEPLRDIPAPPPPRADLSDQDRRASTVERSRNPTNRLPFSRGNTPEMVEAAPAVHTRTESPGPSEPTPQPAAPEPLRLPLPADAAGQPRSADTARGPAVGVIADAIRNVQKYAQKDGFSNLQGGGLPEIAPSIQFDTKGVDFGPWLRRFVAQVRRNWFIPMAAMTLRGHVVVTFYIHRDGRITDVTILRPSSIESFNLSARNAILTSNPTLPLPPEYPDDRAFFTVTFYYNEQPPTL